jgi:hypothetical protein
MGRRNSLIGSCLVVVGIALGALGVLLWQRLQPSENEAEPLPSRCLEATIYLPLNDNQGVAFRQADLDRALEPLILTFGGATLGDQRRGFWRTDDGRVQSEPVRMLTVSFPPGRLGEFRRGVAEIGRRLGQQSVYVRFEEPRVELVAIPAEGGKKGR